MALLNHILGEDKPKEKGVSFPVIMVHYTKLIPSEMNNYSIEGIKELARMIQLSGGVKQNLLARKKTADEYELIAGHRRRLAEKYLVEELGEEQYGMMPVHVEKEDDTLSEINLIITNCAARERSDWEKMMEVERLTELIQFMQTCKLFHFHGHYGKTLSLFACPGAHTHTHTLIHNHKETNVCYK